MTVHIYNEIAHLDAVLVHGPGAEVARMTHHQLDRLLFDDILSPDSASEEHAVLREILASMGADVLEVQDLLAAALQAAPPDAVADLLDRVCEGDAVRDIAPLLSAWEPDRLARSLIEGVPFDEVRGQPLTLSRLRRKLDDADDWLLRPLPNLMFMRDPCISLYDHVVVGRMSTGARARESVLVHFALQHGMQSPPKFLFGEPDLERHPAYRALEGGDVLVLDERYIFVGCSQRTRAHTIERLAREFLFDAFPKLETVYAVMMPRARSVMHLDTVLTQIDSRLFLGHEPLIMNAEECQVVALTRTGAKLLEGLSVRDVLAKEMGSVTVVPCGGDDPVNQNREQWTDGANAVCIGPGHIVLYSRNVHTIRELTDVYGFHRVQLAATDDPEERRRRIESARGHGRVVYTFTGSELSRARGGGRCLTMPLLRGRL